MQQDRQQERGNASWDMLHHRISYSHKTRGGHKSTHRPLVGTSGVRLSQAGRSQLQVHTLRTVSALGLAEAEGSTPS